MLNPALAVLVVDELLLLLLLLVVVNENIDETSDELDVGYPLLHNDCEQSTQLCDGGLHITLTTFLLINCNLL